MLDLKGQFTPKSKIHIIPLTFTAIYQHKSGVFNVFQAKDPQTDGEMEQGPPAYIYIV